MRKGPAPSCILSPQLFNLYLNDLAFSFNNILSDPFVLPNGMKLNSLLYAENLIVLSRSKEGLQSKLLEHLILKLQLQVLKINHKKCFCIGNEKIDIVQDYTHLGPCFSSSGKLTRPLATKSSPCSLKFETTH